MHTSPSLKRTFENFMNPFMIIPITLTRGTTSITPVFFALLLLFNLTMSGYISQCLLCLECYCIFSKEITLYISPVTCVFHSNNIWYFSMLLLIAVVCLFVVKKANYTDITMPNWYFHVSLLMFILFYIPNYGRISEISYTIFLDIKKFKCCDQQMA